MSMFNAIVFGILTFLAGSISIRCPLSIPTVSIVSRCPYNAMEWVSAAKRKSCYNLARIQNCTEAKHFVYHCVLNEQATMLVEVCAPTYYLAGYCARFSEVHKRIINDPGLDCTKFNPPCPPRFQSNESYKYQICYQKNTGYLVPDETLNPKQHDVFDSLSSGLLAMFATIAVTLFLLLIVGTKCKLISFTSTRKKTIFHKEEKDTSKKKLFDVDINHWRDRIVLTKENVSMELESNDETEKGLLDRTISSSQDKNAMEEKTPRQIVEDRVTKETEIATVEKFKKEENKMVDPSVIDTPNSELQEEVTLLTAPSSSGEYKEAVKERDHHNSARKFGQNVRSIDEGEGWLNGSEEMDISKSGMMRYRILSNTLDEWCPHEGLKTIGDVRGALAKMLHIARKHIFVVNKEEGKILNDKTVIAMPNNKPFEVMIANQNRTLVSGCCKMSCGHFTPQDALFEWTKTSLLSGIHSGRTCPECSKNWGMSELMEKSNMSLDEKIFFEQIFMINRRTPSELEKYKWQNFGVAANKGCKDTVNSAQDPK